MSNQPTQPNHNSDEIDIIQLFSYFGRGIKKFFKTIGKFFKWLFHLFISLLILVQKNLVYFLIAAAIGFIGGGLFDHSKSKVYESSMIVQPNFDSAEQLYNNIAYYNELTDSRDSLSLAKEMKIAPEEAGKILSIEIVPFFDKKQKLKLFDDFVRNLDTITRQSFDYDDFESSLTDFDAVFHRITIFSSDNTVAKKMENQIVNSIEKTSFFRKRSDVEKANILLQDSLYKKQLVEIDSLQKVYQKSLIEAARNSNAGTSISLSEGEGTKNQREIELLLQIDEIRQSLVNLNEKKVFTESAINILAELPEKGIKVTKVSKSYKFILPIFFVGILLIFLLLVQLNTFLKKYTR
ncbi:hypothetical protein SAMN05216480_101120 [Pustulibacterium marinum]|uniref:Chain length determinant protein n=1 Tax=Pustulibacterium marinum TaxID=1224947 RepID=A0A1I7ETL8_9FLAO|nr:hypothetical protein [Pustulibacterium marinum]SFU27261.1 hypothetical protein SAMN05216480_101120 [Pustulibacterium marinum]